MFFFFFSSRRRHTRYWRDWSSDVCSSDLLVRQMAEQYPITLVNSVNPYRIEGQTTAAYEICDVLGGAPDYLCLPVGNAGNISAYWLGFKRYAERGHIANRPCMLGFQAEGAAPLVSGMPVEHPETLATAIRIGNPAS